MIADWEKVRVAQEYKSVQYLRLTTDYSLEYFNENSVEVRDLSLIFYEKLRPIGIWPLFAIKRSDASISLISSETINAVLSPIFISGIPKTRILKLVFNFLNEIIKNLNIQFCKLSSNFNTFSYLDGWEKISLDYCQRIETDFLWYLHLNNEYEVIQKSFRKSYKSLIQKGSNYWELEIIDKSNFYEKKWQEFKALHETVSGRQTRTNSTWDIQRKSILQGNAFLVYALEPSQVMVGGGFFDFTEDESCYSTGAYVRDKYDIPISHAIQARAVKELVKKKVKWHLLGEVKNVNLDVDVQRKEINISQFKRGFSSHFVPRISFYLEKDK